MDEGWNEYLQGIYENAKMSKIDLFACLKLMRTQQISQKMAEDYSTKKNDELINTRIRQVQEAKTRNDELLDLNEKLNSELKKAIEVVLEIDNPIIFFSY